MDLVTNSPKNMHLQEDSKLDQSDNISHLIHIFQTEPKVLLQPELDSILKQLYHCLLEIKLLSSAHTIKQFIEAIDTKGFVIVQNTFKVNIRDKNFCILLVLSVLKNCTNIFYDDDCNFFFLQTAMASFDPYRRESIHLLRLIINLNCKLNSSTAAALVQFAQKVSISPLSGFKQLAEIIALQGLKHKSLSSVAFLQFLPLKGISSNQVVLSAFKNLSSDIIMQKAMTQKVIKMFQNNIESREGCLIYKVLIGVFKDDFQLWLERVWKLFYEEVNEDFDYEGEFYQSLLKYWIPQTVVIFHSELYEFMFNNNPNFSGDPMPTFLKAFILLEIKKKFPLDTYGKHEHDNFLKKLFFNSNIHWRTIALQIAGCESRKPICPSAIELCLVKQFLYNQSSLNRDGMNALDNFFNLIGYYVVKNKDESLEKYLDSMFSYGKLLLRAQNRGLGAQLLNCLYTTRQKHKVEVLQQCLEDERFIRWIEQMLVEDKGKCMELTVFAAKIVRSPNIVDNEFLLKFLDNAVCELSIQASESVKNMASFMITTHSLEGIKSLFINIYERLVRLIKIKHRKKIKVIFEATLLFEVFKQLSDRLPQDADTKLKSFNVILTECFPIICSLLEEKYKNEKNDDWFSSNIKREKILEALFNNVCQYLLSNVVLWKQIETPELMCDLLVRVIERSSMRKPTMTSADLLKRAFQELDLNDYKYHLTDETLRKLYKMDSIPNLTIRRYPETRLVLHALCVSDKSPNKVNQWRDARNKSVPNPEYLLVCDSSPTLNLSQSQIICHLIDPIHPTILRWIFSHLIHILSCGNSSDETVSASLHCTEILMSDNNLYLFSSAYASRVILQCVRHFKNRNWIVRNANMQLAKAIIDRFLGVIKGPNDRAKSINDDLFMRYPELAASFYQIMIQRPLNDSALLVMQLFAESQAKQHPFPFEITLITREAFLDAFKKLIANHSDVYGLFAAKAYVSLCFIDDIPDLIQHIAEFIIHNWQDIKRKHTIRNFLLLLQELYDKYAEKNSASIKINNTLVELTKFMSNVFQSCQLDMLLCKLKSFEDCKLDGNYYQDRLHMHNWVPYFLNNTSVMNLPNVCHDLLTRRLPKWLQVKILSIFINRFPLRKILSLDMLIALINDSLFDNQSDTYLMTCKYKIIVLYFKQQQAFDCSLLDRIDCNIDINCIYKTFLTILILNRENSLHHKDFSKKVLKQFQTVPLNEDLAEDMSEILQYLYKIVWCQCDKLQIIKLALNLLIEHGLYHFVCFITKSNIATPSEAVRKLLAYDCLTSYFGCDTLAFQFITDFYRIMYHKDVSLDKNVATYYEEEKDDFIDLNSLVFIVKLFVYQYCEKRQIDCNVLAGKIKCL